MCVPLMALCGEEGKEAGAEVAGGEGLADIAAGAVKDGLAELSVAALGRDHEDGHPDGEFSPAGGG